MDTEEMADAMTGAVQIVDAAFPHGASGKYIELGATGAGGEVGVLELQVSLQD